MPPGRRRDKVQRRTLRGGSQLISVNQRIIGGKPEFMIIILRSNDYQG